MKKGTLRAVHRIFGENPFHSGSKKDDQTPTSPSPVPQTSLPPTTTTPTAEKQLQPEDPPALAAEGEKPPTPLETGAIESLKHPSHSSDSLGSHHEPSSPSTSSAADKGANSRPKLPVQRANSMRTLRTLGFSSNHSSPDSVSPAEPASDHPEGDAKPAPEKTANLKRGFSIKALSRNKLVRPGEELRIKADFREEKPASQPKTPLKASFQRSTADLTEEDVSEKKSLNDKVPETPVSLNFPPELNPHEEGISKEESKRRKRIQAKAYILEELYKTEKNYVDTLNTVVEVFVKPLRAAASTAQPILTNNDIKVIFSAVEEIASVNSAFLEELAEVAKNWAADSNAGELFQKHFAKCDAYTKFMDNYSLGKAALRRNEERSQAFRTFEHERSQMPEAKRQNLGDLFILPIQRVTRYTLLLQDLIKNTEPETPEYPSLETAMHTMKDLALKVNEVKRKEETFTKLFEIQKEVQDCPVSPRPLLLFLILYLLDRPLPLLHFGTRRSPPSFPPPGNTSWT